MKLSQRILLCGTALAMFLLGNGCSNWTKKTEEHVRGLITASGSTFGDKDVENLKKRDVPLSYILNFDKKGEGKYDGFQISRFYQLGLSVDEALNFEDTDKPNAVFAYPYHDDNDAFENSTAVEFFKKLREHYDIKVAFAENEQQAYDAIISIPNVELLVLTGHGEPDRLKFSVGTEDKRIDLGDEELKEYIQKLSPNAVIYLNSCSTAKGGKDEENLANFVINMADGRKVIAATEDYNSGQVKVLSFTPLDLTIESNESGEPEFTYKGN